MSFPTLVNDTFGEGNSDEYYAEWIKRQPGYAEGRYDACSAYLDPVLGPQMHEDWKCERGVDHMFGGFRENRSRILRGTYLDGTGGYIHQGIDYYVPAGTPIAIDFPGIVMFIDCDHPEPGGWGTRAGIIRDGSSELFLIAHLGPQLACRPGDHVEAGQIIAEVGAYPTNGGWVNAHPHLQRLSPKGRKRFYSDPSSVDGYGHPRDAERDAELYLDPDPFFILPNRTPRL